MINERQDLIQSLPGGAEILCAKIFFSSPYHGERTINTLRLKKGFTQAEYELFLCSLADPGFVREESFVWFKDGSWLERIDITGMDVWMHFFYPSIPDDL